MARMAVVNDITSLVDNVIEASPSFHIPGHTLVASAVANIGDTYEDGHFTPPAPPVPPSTETAEDGFTGLMERRIAALEAAGDQVGALTLRVELLQQQQKG